MTETSGWLLVGAVAAVGVLHTIVPDHWVPITLMARQHRWTRAQTAHASFRAGLGHVLSTLVIALVVWLAGAAVATRFGHWVDAGASLALIGFGAWIAVSASRDLQHGGHGHSHHHHHHHDHHDHNHPHGRGHAHATRRIHGQERPPIDTGHGPIHLSMLEAGAQKPFGLTPALADPAAAHDGHHTHAPGDGHRHSDKPGTRTALLLILGSSPMVESIPAFFAASRHGAGLIIVMSIVFGLATIATYMLLCDYSTARLKRVRLGSFERYGEVLSGVLIALVGAVFWVWPIL